MENKRGFIKYLLCVVEGYVLTLGIWHHPNYGSCFSSSKLSSDEGE